MDEAEMQRVRQFLAAHTTLTLATVAPNGQPQAAALFYAEQADLSLIFISEKKARHSANIARNPHVALTIQADGQTWQAIQGLQIEGTAAALAGQAARAAKTVYLAKFPIIAANPLLAAALNLVTFYRITPAWMRFINNTVGFGHKEEWRF